MKIIRNDQEFELTEFELVEAYQEVKHKIDVYFAEVNLTFDCPREYYSALPEKEMKAIIVTGGIAHSEYCMKVFLPWIDYLAPIVMMPGEDEMGSLAYNAWCAMKGERTLQVYNP